MPTLGALPEADNRNWEYIKYRRRISCPIGISSVETARGNQMSADICSAYTLPDMYIIALFSALSVVHL